jgi:hypothetical protein
MPMFRRALVTAALPVACVIAALLVSPWFWCVFAGAMAPVIADWDRNRNSSR